MSMPPFDRRKALPALHMTATAPPPPMLPEQAPGDLFGLRSAVDSVLRQGRLAFTVFALTMAAALAYALLAAPVYKADTLVRLDSRVKDSLAPVLLGNEKGPAEAERTNVAGEQELLLSREVLLPVIAQTGADIELSLARRHGWLPVGARHGVQVPVFQLPAAQQGKNFLLQLQAKRWQLMSPTGTPVARGDLGQSVVFGIDGGEGRIEVQASANLPSTQLRVRQLPPLKAVEEVSKRLRALELTRESGVLRISYEDESATRSAALLNGLVKAYLDNTIARKANDGARALAFVEGQLPALKARLDTAEQELAQYQRSARAAPLNMESDALLRQRGDLERQATELQVKHDQLAQHLTPAHPELAAVERQQATLRAALGRITGQADRLPTQSRDVVRLQREAQTATQQYTAMLNHVQQLRVADSGWLANGRQLDKAMVPTEPNRPQKSAVLSVGAGLGLVLATMAALAAHALQPTVTGTQELLARAAPPTLAVIPESAAQKRLMSGRLADGSLDELGTHRLLARTAPDEAAVESLRSVHLSLMLRERQTPSKVVLVTSPSSGTGKAFVAANLAAVMAESGRRVLLIEADLHKPGVHRLVAIDEMAQGLTDLLSRSCSLDQVIHRHPSAGFDVILQGSRQRSMGAVLMSPLLDKTMAELRTRYDHIVINGAPTSPTQDALLVGRHADMALMVVRAEQSLLAETRAALRRLEQGGIRLEGLLFNGVKRNRLNAPLVT